MKLAKKSLFTGAALAAVLASTGTAAAAFPNFSDCPRNVPGVTSCIDIQSPSGTMVIKGFSVPLPNSLEIRGGIDVSSGEARFVAPSGTNGFFARPVPVPGGLLGINFPIPGNSVAATAELAGPASSIRINLGDLTVSLPLKLRLSNPLIGPNCHIGTNSKPANVTLITGTTAPPAPNRPISGRVGDLSVVDGTLIFSGNTNVDNSFSIPSASSCGLGIGLIDALVDAKLKLPSASGNNSLTVNNNVAVRAAQ